MSNLATRRTNRQLNRGWLVIAVLLLSASFGLAFIHPSGNVSLRRSDKELMHTAQIDRKVLELMQRSCQNCHSEQTVWPWYSHFAPVSWLIEKDVTAGRSHWNMSSWEHNSSEERERILSLIGPMVRNRKMPLPQYLFLHPEAKLSGADADLLYQWSRSERRRLKAESQAASLP